MQLKQWPDPTPTPLTCCHCVGSGEAGTSWYAGELCRNIHFCKVWRSRSGPFQSGYLDVWLGREAPCRQTQTLLVPTCAFLRSKCGQTLDMLYWLHFRFHTETNGSELPGQRLSNAGRHNHHEGEKNGPHHVCVLPGGSDRPVWLHGLLSNQVRPAWLSRVPADGGELLALTKTHCVTFQRDLIKSNWLQFV